MKIMTEVILTKNSNLVQLIANDLDIDFNFVNENSNIFDWLYEVPFEIVEFILLHERFNLQIFHDNNGCVDLSRFKEDIFLLLRKNHILRQFSFDDFNYFYGKKYIYEYILENDINQFHSTNEQLDNLFVIVSRNGDFDVMDQMLRKYHKRIDINSQNVLIYVLHNYYNLLNLTTVENRYKHIITFLIRKEDYDLNYVCTYDLQILGYQRIVLNPLIMTVLLSLDDIVVLFLENQDRVDVNVKSYHADKQGVFFLYYLWTALHYAEVNNNIRVVKLLLKFNEIDINQVDDNGSFLLFISPTNFLHR